MSPIEIEPERNLSFKLDEVKMVSQSKESEDTESAKNVVELREGRVHLTDQDNKRILRKTDKAILTVLVWVYFLQIIDKSALGYGSTFGLQTDTGLVGTQYSLVGSMAPIAQLCWLPFSSYLIVKVQPRILIAVLMLLWGIAQALMAAVQNYGGLLATRFLLGLFEAACLPLFGVLTSQWYRRSEQPLRIAAWLAASGAATIIGSAISFGLGKISSTTVKSWQIIFLFVGLVTIVTAPVAYWRLDNNIETARFLTEHERAQAVERLRANNTGIGSKEFKWSEVAETFLDPKTYLWFFMALLLNVGAGVTNVFGPLILSGLGFDASVTLLLNIPFGVVQVVVILFASYAAYKFKRKAPVLLVLMIPVVAGLAILYALPRTSANTAPNLVAYYLLAFLFGGNPILITWLVGNTAGTTKKSCLMVIYNIGVSAGNIIGPLLFNATDKPAYLPGLRAVLGMFCALVVAGCMQWALLIFLNKGQERKRVAEGKPAKLTDVSMMTHYVEQDKIVDGNAEAALHDLTDRQNSEFIYIY